MVRNCKDGERAAAVLATLGYYGHEQIYTALIETTITSKTLRDTDTEEMLDIIYGSQVIDIGGTYLGFDTNFRKVFYCFYDLMSVGNNNVASFYEKSEKAILKALDNLVECSN